MKDGPAIVCATGYSDVLEDAFSAGQEAARRVLARITPRARSVGILLSSIEFDHEAVLRGIRSVLDIPLIGCTTYSESTEEGYFDDSVSLMVLSGDQLDFGIGLGEALAADPEGAVERAWSMARAQLGSEPTAALVFPDAALSCTGEAVVEALRRVSGGRVPLAGGCPGDGGRFQKTYQFFAGRVVSDALPLLLLGGDIEACVVSRSAWQPMGAPGTITHVEGNRLHQIDGQPAIAFLKRYIGEVDDPNVMGSYPIALLDETAEHEGRRHHVIRSPFFYDPTDGALSCGGLLRAGSPVQLGYTTREQILESAKDAAQALREHLAGRAPLGVLFASCGARKLWLGLATEKELAGVREGLGGRLPIAGFYSYGEIGAFDSRAPQLERPRFHNFTLVLLAFYVRGSA